MQIGQKVKANCVYEGKYRHIASRAKLSFSDGVGRKYGFQTDTSISNPACHIMRQSGEEFEKEKTKREIKKRKVVCRKNGGPLLSRDVWPK